MTIVEPSPTSAPSPLYCATHPQVETTLRCNRCEKLICPKCAVLTPTGYRCKDCVRGQQKVFETVRVYDYPVAFVVTAFLSFLGSQVAAVMGFFVLFIAPMAGVIIAEAVRFVIRKRRGRYLAWTAAAAAVIGALPVFFSTLGGIITWMNYTGVGGAGAFVSLLWPGVYAVMVASTVYYRLSGIRIS